jgi:hypothetical protein
VFYDQKVIEFVLSTIPLARILTKVAFQSLAKCIEGRSGRKEGKSLTRIREQKIQCSNYKGIMPAGSTARDS